MRKRPITFRPTISIRRHRRDRVDLAPYGRDLRGRQSADSLCGLFALLPPRGRRSAGRDVAGCCASINFYKLEQYVICGDDDEESAMASSSARRCRGLLQALEIPYQVVETSTGDMGAGKFRMNDIESSVRPSGKYRETHSCSTLHDCGRRAAQTSLSGMPSARSASSTRSTTPLWLARASSCPCSKTIQEADGRVKLPEALRELMGGDYLSTRTSAGSACSSWKGRRWPSACRRGFGSLDTRGPEGRAEADGTCPASWPTTARRSACGGFFLFLLKKKKKKKKTFRLVLYRRPSTSRSRAAGRASNGRPGGRARDAAAGDEPEPGAKRSPGRA